MSSPGNTYADPPKTSDISNRGHDDVCAPAPNGDESSVEIPNRIMAALRDSGHVFPEQPLLRAREYRSLIVPALIETLRAATDCARFGVPPVNDAHLFAIHLLAEFQVKETLPFLLDLLALSEESSLLWYSYCLYETMPGVLYRIVGNDVGFYETRLLDPKTSSVLRNTLLDVLPYLVRSGAMGVSDCADLLRTCFQMAVEASDKPFATGVLDLLLCFGDETDVPAIDAAFSKGTVDNGFVDRDEAVRELREEGRQDEEIERRTKHGCSDVIEEMRAWARFNPSSTG